MARVVGVRFQQAGRVHYYTAEAPLAVGDRVVADTPGGPALGWVVIAPDQVVVAELPEPPRAGVRKAAPDDLRRLWSGAGSGSLRSAARQPGLPLLLVATESGALPQTPESRDRLLPPDRGAGVCERLLYTLGRENQQYIERKRALPRLGKTVETPTGPGLVVEVKVLQERVTVQLPDGTLVELSGSPLMPVESSGNDGHRGRWGKRPAPSGERESLPSSAEEQTR